MALSAEYLAGFFDGEGCVCIGTTSVAGKAVGGYLAIILSGNCLTLLKQIKEEHGGSFRVRPNGTGNLKLSTRMAVKFLRFILPHLIIKKEVAEVGIALGTRPKEPPMCQAREDLRRRIHELNRITSPKSGPKSRFEKEIPANG